VEDLVLSEGSGSNQTEFGYNGRRAISFMQLVCVRVQSFHYYITSRLVCVHVYFHTRIKLEYVELTLILDFSLLISTQPRPLVYHNFIYIQDTEIT